MDDLQKHIREGVKDPVFRKAWEETEQEYQLVRQLVSVRLKRGLTQEELAKRVGTKQSTIARIENGGQNVSLKTLTKLAEALDAQIKISIRPR